MRYAHAILAILAACGGGVTGGDPTTSEDEPKATLGLATATATGSSVINAPTVDAVCNARNPISSAQVYAAALRFFDQHTVQGGPYAIASELEEERPSFVFENTSDRRNRQATQLWLDELNARWPRSVMVPLTRPLRATQCYDEVWLDLTENGRYAVIVEQATHSPVFMYSMAYRP